jgi:DNA polymerase I-like protein with 3'-5' exonuclease and polymerase domains
VTLQGQTGAWINPDSGDQCAALLFDQLGLPWTKVTKSKKATEVR